ncbi:MAG: hypothetical protein JWP89_3594 [Schlesneria sp.]|nr:hypothetical protein [Schlesneria sp.]
MTSTKRHAGSAPPMTRVEWAIARYNWYRACGKLSDSPQNTVPPTYERSADPPPPKPHLKWYPLSKLDDDVATTYQPPAASAQRHRYSQRIDAARYQAEHGEQAKGDDPRAWSRVDWAIARYNWYRACGLLADSPRTAEIARYHRSPDPPPPKPHLKWYPLSKPDDNVPTTYQRSVQATPPATRRRYCQRVEHARARAMIARYQAEQQKTAKGTGPRPPFVESDHNRVAKGSSHGGEFASMASVSQTTEGKHAPVSTEKQQPAPADAERFAKILKRMKALHPNQYAYFVANRGSLADDGKTWNNWDQPLSWGEDNSVRIRSGAKSDFEILRFVINSINKAPGYRRWLEAKIKSGAIKPPPEQPPELWRSNATQAKAQREQQYQYMALAGATPNEIATLQNDVLRHEWFGPGDTSKTA